MNAVLNPHPGGITLVVAGAAVGCGGACRITGCECRGGATGGAVAVAEGATVTMATAAGVDADGPAG